MVRVLVPFDVESIYIPNHLDSLASYSIVGGAGTWSSYMVLISPWSKNMPEILRGSLILDPFSLDLKSPSMSNRSSFLIGTPFSTKSNNIGSSTGGTKYILSFRLMAMSIGISL